MRFLTWSLNFWPFLDTILTVLDPDPYSQYGSGSRGAISIRMDPRGSGSETLKKLRNFSKKSVKYLLHREKTCIRIRIQLDLYIIGSPGSGFRILSTCCIQIRLLNIRICNTDIYLHHVCWILCIVLLLLSLHRIISEVQTYRYKIYAPIRLPPLQYMFLIVRFSDNGCGMWQQLYCHFFRGTVHEVPVLQEQAIYVSYHLLKLFPSIS